MRKHSIPGGVFVSLLLLSSNIPVAWAGEYYVVPYDVDPPIQVDGAIGDWADVPNPIDMKEADHVTWFREAKAKVWTGPDDLSATVRLAWRHDGIYVAAEITDDVVQQPYRGRAVWKADYVNLWLDVKPSFEPGRTEFGEGQYHIGMSPGNFNGTAGGEGVIKPRIFAFMPQNLPLENGQAAARRTDNGYIIEAFLPFGDLGIKDVRPNTRAAFEIAVSDSDGKPATQEMVLTRGTAKWQLQRSRLLPLLFGDGNGRADVPDRTIPLLSEETAIQAKGAYTRKFTLDTMPADMEAFIAFRARSDLPTVEGYCNHGLAVELNGTRFEEDRLTNRPDTMQMKGGHTVMVIRPDGRLTLPHAPDFTSTDENARYQIAGQKVAEFVFTTDGLLKPGENTLVLRHAAPPWQGKDWTMVIGDMELRIRPRRAGSSHLRPAPTGPLPVHEPRSDLGKTYADLDTGKDGRIRFTIGSDPFVVKSRFSTPDGQWRTGSNEHFKHDRRIREHDEWIIVEDTFENLTGRDLPLMYVHESPIGTEETRFWLGGLRLGALTGNRSVPGNPSAFGARRDSGVGLVALNDEFRVHVEQRASEGDLKIGDFSFVLGPGATYTAEWAILPVTKPDFWRFINTARRMMDVNFTLKHMFAFAMQRPPVYDWSDATLRRYVENKSANFVVQSNYGVKTKEGKASRNTQWMRGPHDQYRDFQKRIRKLFPDGSVKTGIYYHCFLDTTRENDVRFAADRALDAKGEHISYGTGRHAHMKLFVPTRKNGFGKEIRRWVDLILDDIGADGVFWDEFGWSTRPYCHGAWDGCTADIDDRTHKIVRRKTSLSLMSRDFREDLVKRIMKTGAPLVVNGPPVTRTLARHKFMAFTESGNVIHCRGMLLYTPVALGDHLTERNPRDAHRVMLKALDHGCLYAWYANRVFPEHRMLTEHMYPFTPIEIHSGYVIGRERIITNRSGLFGWGDGSEFEAHVYDRSGKETDKYEVGKVTRDGKTYAEVRIPGGCAAAIVRVAKD